LTAGRVVGHGGGIGFRRMVFELVESTVVLNGKRYMARDGRKVDPRVREVRSL